ncbi:YcaO-like family protein [Kineococcus sp. LSe6-4]|uniref:YcaO-like family protein n=1 Tax=Kineococcus halophytocola TaxID=3234027 RepID=A0ABV4H7C5_9ACTN
MPYPDLVDHRTGIVRSLRAERVPVQFPAGFDLVTATLSDTTRFAPWAADPAGAGYALNDPAAVLGAALGEAVERYCGNAVPEGLAHGSARSLRAAGRRVLDLGALALFSAEQYAEPGFPAAPLDDDLEIEWASSVDGTLVPASLVWPSYPGSRRGFPLTNPVVQAGLAAGRTRADALTSAVREIVERDAMTLAWYGERGFTRVREPRWLRDLSRGPGGDLETRYVVLPQEFRIPVLAALVRDRVTGYLSLGTGVADDPVDAALKAFGEALQLQLVLRDHDDPETALGRVGGTPGSPLKAWRADRRYGQSYRPDRRDAIDYACHLQLHLDPAVQGEFEERFAASIDGVVDLSDLRADADPVRAVLDQGFDLLEVDLTTPDVRALGLHVLRVVVPGTYSNSAVGLPFLGGTRLDVRRTTRVPLPH